MTFQALDQARSAHILEHRRELGDQLFHRRPQHPPLAGHGIGEAARPHYVQHGTSGSTGTRAVCGPMASSSALRLLSGTWSKPSTSGPKPARYFLLPVAASMARVRPWKAPSKQMMRNFSPRPVSAIALRIILTMPSLASAPELQKNTLSANEFATSRSARRSAPGMRYRLETCITLWAYSAIASARCCLPWPSEPVAR